MQLRIQRGLPLLLAYIGATLIALYFTLRPESRYIYIFEIAGELCLIAGIVTFATERIERSVISQVQEMGAFSRAGLSEVRLLNSSSVAMELRELLEPALSIQASMTRKSFEELLPILLSLFDEQKRVKSEIRILIGTDKGLTETDTDSSERDTGALVNAISRRAHLYHNVEIRVTQLPLESFVLTEDWFVVLLFPRAKPSRESLFLKFKTSSEFAEGFVRSFHIVWDAAKALTGDRSLG